MGQIRQLQLSYNPNQDRLLFRLSTASGRHLEEYRFSLTRRYVRLLWKALLEILKNNLPDEDRQKSEPTQAASMALKHQEVVAQADFKTPFKESHTYPLGEKPILVGKLSLKKGPQGGQLLSMHALKGAGLDFHLNDQLLHSFCQLLTQATQRAEWNLDLDFAQAESLISKQNLN
ncbi:MAG: hypothetical protein QM496_01225 [Verrucomicrobiota bacterium]